MLKRSKYLKPEVIKFNCYTLQIIYNVCMFLIKLGKFVSKKYIVCDIKTVPHYGSLTPGLTFGSLTPGLTMALLHLTSLWLC